MHAKEIEKEFQKILEARAKRLGVSVDELVEIENKPRFIRAAEKRARQLGLSIEEVLDQDLQSLRDSSYPRPDCLQPTEVEQYINTGELSDSNSLHLGDCESCRTLIMAAKPKEEWIQAFLEEVRCYLPRAVVFADRESHDSVESEREDMRNEEGPSDRYYHVANLFNSL